MIGILHERSNEEHTPSNGAGIGKTVDLRYYNVGLKGNVYNSDQSK